MKRALITGITGQDGAYLAKFLLGKGYKVYGTYRRLSTPNFWRLQYLNIFEDVELFPADLLDGHSMAEVSKTAKPHEIYNLAAQSFVGASFEQPIV
jgi:GDPmannose 4,6-dehydratase